VKAQINLGALTDEDVRVELYQGSVSATGEITNGVPVIMTYQGQDSQGNSLYTVNISYTNSGLQGLSLRVLPSHDYLSSPYEPGLVLWAEPEKVSVDLQSNGKDPALGAEPAVSEAVPR
jgi:glycogen phosphorylase